MKKQRQSIAVIGSGITGLSASWLLRNEYEVTLFEKNDYLGGHTHTHDVQEDEKQLAVDSGFIVYNEKNYPNLVGLFDELDVETQATDMSFAFSLDKGELEYSGSDLNGMFAQRGNLLSIRHWSLIKEIVRFNKVSHAALEETKNGTQGGLVPSDGSTLTLNEFLAENNFSDDLQQHYLLPMGAAIWSCPAEIMGSFPAYSFLQFFANHGLIDLQNRPQWRSVVGGSREYIRKMMSEMQSEITLQNGATNVIRSENGVEVVSNEESYHFDQVIFACHADEAVTLLNEASADEQAILSCFKYQNNKAYLHTDVNLMPKRTKAWCSWNYLARTKKNNGNSAHAEKQVTVTYWMNRLQNLKADKDYLVTLNPFQKPDSAKIIKEMDYFHPLFDREAMHAQTRLDEIQGKNNAWFCGSYTGYGFHEDALSSSVAVCEKLGVIAPWNNVVDEKEEGVRRAQ